MNYCDYMKSTSESRSSVIITCYCSPYVLPNKSLKSHQVLLKPSVTFLSLGKHTVLMSHLLISILPYVTVTCAQHGSAAEVL